MIRYTRRRGAGSQCFQLALLLDMLQASPQKIDLQCLAADFPLQLGNLAFLRAPLSVAGKSLGPVVPQLAPPAVQHVGVYLAGAGHLGQRSPQVQPPDGLFLKLFRELPSRQSHDSILHLMKNES
jgi:hypothetical protein